MVEWLQSYGLLVVTAILIAGRAWFTKGMSGRPRCRLVCMSPALDSLVSEKSTQSNSEIAVSDSSNTGKVEGKAMKAEGKAANRERGLGKAVDGIGRFARGELRRNWPIMQANSRTLPWTRSRA